MKNAERLQKIFEIYKTDYLCALESCNSWIACCEECNDMHSKNFYVGQRSALIFINAKMEELFKQLGQCL